MQRVHGRESVQAKNNGLPGFLPLLPELSVNRSYLGMAIVASSVSMIDDVPLPVPVNEAGVEAVMERLGDDGAAAVSAAIKPASLEQVAAAAGN